ncbi:hypothetical protein H6F98_14710 [Microcoleus sp. FACHB-SPT15]|uniref:COG1470 family protein n=1 Tax=Microcoleus sp. FACHB-SPT15 TaxID=2692830 RepID=UPI0017847CEA|nr:hypothetical protein [Microcoleus sp. FACHB-SPT15]MBD1806697.1 hypothetical protein [Microcoleus sp. FACHB-SPT15]
MTGNQLSSEAGQPRNSSSLVELRRLTAEQQQLLTWMAQQEAGVSLAEIAAQTRKSEEEVSRLLAELRQQDLIFNVGSDRYRASSPTQGDSLADSYASGSFSDNLLQSLSPSKPLAVILNSTGKDVVTSGGTFELAVTVTNRGSQSAVVHIFIDDLSILLRQWCQSSQEYLALSPDQSGEVVFRFQIPVEVLPGTFHYLLVVDAPQHYPEYPPARYSQQLEILPPSLDIVKASDPTFVIQPPTSSAKPAVLQPSSVLQLQVLVYNRSDRVDRFRLTCTDLPESWFTITYPQETQGLGLVLEAESLGLNPGDQSQILLLITPPSDALAANYIPTVRLYSENNPDLNLLDLVYFQVLPIYLLQPALRPIISRIREQSGLLEVQLVNSGNTERELLLRVNDLDGGESCTYRLEPNEVKIAPKETARAKLTVQPTRWWRRPLWGGGRVLNFQVELEDRQQVPLPSSLLPGYVTWAARPWWQLLPLVLAGLGTLALLVWLIWWLFFRPPVSPKILEFYVEDSRYSAANGDVAQVGWQIQFPNRIRSLRITGQAPDGRAISGPLVYDFSQSLPPALKPFCTLEQVLLTCRNVRTDARQAGEYIFELTLIPKRGRGQTLETRKTDRIAIDPVPLPQVVEFKPTQAAYLEAKNTPANQSARGNTQASPAITNPSDIRLNWVVTRPQDLQALQLVGRTPDGAIARPPQRFNFAQGIPKELQEFCEIGNVLVCQNLGTGVRQAGDYIFELIAIPKDESAKAPEPTKTHPIKIQPRPAQILNFRINNQDARPKYLIPMEQGQPPLALVVSWNVEGGGSTAVQLLPSPGSVPLQGAVAFPLSQQPESQTITLQVSNGVGQPITRSVTIETFDPTPTDPAATAAAAVAAAAANARQNAEAMQEQSGASSPSTPPSTSPSPPSSTSSPSPTPEPSIPSLNSPAPSTSDRLSPSELPPQFD